MSAAAAPRSLALHRFREAVLHGEHTDDLGNRFFIHAPAGDTFFACLSFAQYRNDGQRLVIRRTLLQCFVELLTGSPCGDAAKWATQHGASGGFGINVSARRHPAFKSLLATHLSTDDDNKLSAAADNPELVCQAAHNFVAVNLEPGRVWCRMVFAYLYCEHFHSDVVFYRARPARGELTGDEMVVDREYEICKLDGRPTCVVTALADRRRRRPAASREDDTSSSCSSSSVSDSDSYNWMTTHLLYAEDELGGARFELLHTPDLNALRNGFHTDITRKRQQRYQVRMVYASRTESGEHSLRNESIRANGIAYMNAPASRGWKVYSLLMGPDEVYPQRIYQIHTREMGSMTDRGIGPDRTIFVYLYFMRCSGQPKAVFVSSLKGSPYVTAPSFAISDDQLGIADGVLAVITSDKKHADRHVQMETGVKVTSPGFDSDEEEEEEEDVIGV